MKSKRNLEGYLIIDNSNVGEPVAEYATLTCSHCHRQQIVQPLRTRERPYCRKCDHYICDQCAVVAKLNGGECQTMNSVLDNLQEKYHGPLDL